MPMRMGRVVLVKEDHGWYAFFCTDPNVCVQDILEAFADRATIEQALHHAKAARREGSVGQWPAAGPQSRRAGRTIWLCTT